MAGQPKHNRTAELSFPPREPTNHPPATQPFRKHYCEIELATEEKTLFALAPMRRIVPTTMTRITASMTAYSAISCPSSSHHNLCASCFNIVLFSCRAMIDDQ